MYRLVDEYSLFYLTWMDGKEQFVNFHRSQKFFIWSGYAFENICIKHTRQVIQALQLPTLTKSVSYWKKGKDALPGAQIDLLIDRTDRYMNLVEIKFCEREYVIKKEYADLLNQRKSIFQQMTNEKKTLFNTLLTPFGAYKNPPYLSSIDRELTMDALFTF